jgi:BirA family biotin operon repressor/biotin-[acetyl-CoA-carboxylase] ligase
MFDAFPADLAAALAAARERLGPFHRLRYRAEVESTNDLALALADAGEPEGTSVLADTQTRGRGRRGRDWFSPPDAGVYLSSVIRPGGPASVLPFVTLAAGVAAARAVRAATSLPVELKWPNDIVVGRPWRKLGGLLCEAVGAEPSAVVVGIGVNVLSTAYPREIADRATAIETELGRAVDRAELVVSLLAHLRGAIDDLHASRREVLREAWRELGQAGLAGCPVRWQQQGRTRRGRARDIDHDGALLVETEGRVERIISGEVVWEGLSRE